MGQGYTKGVPIDVDGTLAQDSDLLVPSQKAVKTYVDTSLATKQDTLVGTESVLLPDRLLFKQNTAVAHTGVTGETVIATYLLPANTVEANDIIKWYLYYTMTNNANAKEIKCYFNTTANLSGSPIQVAVRNTVSLGGSPFGREIIGNNSQTSQRVWATTSNLIVPENGNTIAMSTIAIDFTVNQYMVITVNLGVGTDTVTMQWLWAKLMR